VLGPNAEEHFMVNQAKPEQCRPKGDKNRILTHLDDGEVAALLLHADVVVQRVVAKALSNKASRQTSKKSGSTRVPRLSKVERELGELKKVVQALAVRSVFLERQPRSLNVDATTVLDAEVAYRLLENPPEPNEALRRLLALR
jgi:hypothetical protein